MLAKKTIWVFWGFFLAEINQSARSDTSRALILTQQKISERRREQVCLKYTCILFVEINFKTTHYTRREFL